MSWISLHASSCGGCSRCYQSPLGDRHAGNLVGVYILPLHIVVHVCLHSQQITKVLRDPSTLFLLLSQEIIDAHHTAMVNHVDQPTPSPSAANPSSQPSLPNNPPSPPRAPTTPITYHTLQQSLLHLPPPHQHTVALFLRLHDDVQRCVYGDQMFSPARDASRHEAGMVHEVQLYEQLEAMGVAFLTEDMMRAKVLCLGVVGGG